MQTTQSLDRVGCSLEKTADHGRSSISFTPEDRDMAAERHKKRLSRRTCYRTHSPSGSSIRDGDYGWVLFSVVPSKRGKVR